MHSMQAGYLEKAQKYTDKALMQLEKLKSELVNWFLCFYKKTKQFNHEYLYNMDMWFWNLKKKFGGFSCVRLLIFISMFQCWTAAPSSLPFKSFYWSISSCVDSSLATRPLHYKRYIVSVCHGHFLNFVVFNRWQLIVHSEVQQP